MATRDELDELFGEEGARPRPRTALVVALLAGGLLLAVGGLGCTAVPGALVVLLAWGVAQKESDRVESGFLPADVATTVRRLRLASGAALVVVVALLLLQATLLGLGVYDLLGGELLGRLVRAPSP